MKNLVEILKCSRKRGLAEKHYGRIAILIITICLGSVQMANAQTWSFSQSGSDNDQLIINRDKSNHRSILRLQTGGMINTSAWMMNNQGGYDGQLWWGYSTRSEFDTHGDRKMTLNKYGNLTLNEGSLFFGRRNGQFLNLWDDAHGVGVQNSTTYFRTSNHYAWFKGGVHSDNEIDAGGGAVQMVLNASGFLGIGTADPTAKLHVNGISRFENKMDIVGDLTVQGHIMAQGSFGVSGDAIIAGDVMVDSELNFEKPTLSNNLRQTINFQGNRYTMGMQTNTMYFRSGSNFAWFKDGSHNDAELKPGEGGAVQMVLNASGNLGIGTDTPDKGRLHVKGSVHVEGSDDTQIFHISSGLKKVFVGDYAYEQYLAASASASDESPISSLPFHMWVDGGIVTEDLVMANPSEWADHVFKNDYPLADLNEVELFIRENGHLPNIPSEEEVLKNGYSMAQITRKFLEKIEELTLYTIEQEKKIASLKKAQNVQLDMLLKRLDILESKAGG